MNSKRIYNTKLVLSIMLIISMVLSMIPAYAMTGQVVMNEAHVTSWDDLVAQFGGAEPNTVVIPEDTTVYVDGYLYCENGNFTITGGGTLKRGDIYSRQLIDIQKDGNVTIDNIIIDGKSNSFARETNSVITMANSASLSLINGTVIKNNKANSDGSAISNYYGDLNIGSGCKIEGNSTTKTGSAIFMVPGDTGKLTIDGAEISNNIGGYAVEFNTATNNIVTTYHTITNTKISNNTGGGIQLNTKGGVYEVELQGCEISENTATNGAGLNSYLNRQSVTIKDSTFENNIADYDGGAIYSQSSINFENTSILNNTSTNGKGGGIFGSYGSNYYIKGGLLEGNKDTSHESDNIYIEKGTLDVSEGATIKGSITVNNMYAMGDIYLHGLVYLEDKIFGQDQYVITAALDEKSIIEIGTATADKPINTNEIYKVAKPAAGYTISEQDFNCFKINGKSGHPVIEEGNLGLYMGDELSSLTNWNEFMHSGNIVAWKGSFTISWDENNYYNYNPPQTTTITAGEKITLPQEPVDASGKKEFAGWFTEKVGGTQVTEDTVYTKIGDSTYYAHWKEDAKYYSIYGIVKSQGKPLSGVTVQLQAQPTSVQPTVPPTETTVTDEYGQYEFANKPSGMYKVKVDFGAGKEDTAFVTDSDVQMNFEMNTGTIQKFSISGTVSNLNEHLEGVIVELHTQTPTTDATLIETNATDKNGYYKFENIQNGNHIVRVDYGGGKEKVATIQNTDASVNFDMFIGTVTTYVIYGTVKNEGQPLDGAIAELYTPASTTPIRSKVTDANGKFKFEGLGNGNYIARVKYDEDKVDEKEVVIKKACVTIDFDMNTGGIATFKISGNVKNNKGQALENVAVNLLDANSSGKLMNTVTDVNGSYKFENLLNGSYIVEAIAADGKATKTAAITNSNVEVYLEIASKEPVDPGEDDGDNTTGSGDTGGGSGGGNESGGGTGGGDGGGSGGGNTTPPTETEKPKPTPPTETEKPKPTPPTETEKPKPTYPVETEEPKPVLPIAPEQPVPSEPIPFPADEPSEPPVYEEEVTEPVIETPDIEEPTVPEENISEEVVDNKVSGDETTGASNSFMETFKKILLVAAISLLGLLTLGLLWLMLLAWYRRVKIFNNINTDEYKEDEWSLIHKTFIKKEDKGIYYLLLPEEIVSEFVTNSNQVVLKEAFVQRHHGDIMMIRIEDTDLAYSARIDNSSNIIKFNYSDFKVEEQ